MPQAGIHGMVAIASRKWMPKREWFLLGVVLGSVFPDLDNFVVAYAVLAKLPDPEGYHRTFTHSLFTVLAVIFVFYILSLALKNEKWKNFGNGLGAGILMHIALDLVLWFGGVRLLWPLSFELNFWRWFVTPAWLKILLETGEFLAFGLYLLLLDSLALRFSTDLHSRRSLRMWASLQFALFILFTLLFFILGSKGLSYQVYGGLYLLSLVVIFVITLRMKRTIETT